MNGRPLCALFNRMIAVTWVLSFTVAGAEGSELDPRVLVERARYIRSAHMINIRERGKSEGDSGPDSPHI